MSPESSCAAYPTTRATPTVLYWGEMFRLMTMAIVRVMVMAMTMAMLMTTVTAMAMVMTSSITDGASDSQQLVLGQAGLLLSQVKVLGQRVVLAHLAKSQVMSCLSRRVSKFLLTTASSCASIAFLISVAIFAFLTKSEISIIIMLGSIIFLSFVLQNTKRL